MSIGIITHHSAHNYGAMLQAYALQKYLKNNYDKEVKIINLRTKEGIKAYKIIKKPKKLTGYIWVILKLVHYVALKKRHRAFEKFLNDYIDKTKIYKSFEEITTFPPNFDYYISGSDQVFSPKGKELRAYYLDFGSYDKKRIAYAPSFGYKTVPNEKKELIKKLLLRFNHLSAREVSGCNIIKTLINKEVPNVLDPVFLLNPADYHIIANPVKLKSKNYILCYALVGMKKQIPLAKKLKEITGLPIVLIKDSALLPVKGIDKIIRFAGPREFLWLFANANYVVTDSFHGTAFSLVFRKNFFSTIAIPEKAERIYSILKETGLEDRIVDKPGEINIHNLEVDYKIPYKRLKEKIKISKEYLKMATK